MTVVDVEKPQNKKSQHEKSAKAGFAAALTQWYRANGRTLPWRETTDPYHIWVSEIMLQQTQVATVLPYYDRFLTALPTIQSLAEAPQQQLMKLWEGLGYYARARNLQKAAQAIMAEHQGRFPSAFDAVEALCGIGRSTAGAILTFAYGQRHPLLDGNVKRVLSRLYAIEAEISEKAAIETLWQHSSSLLAEAEDPYDFNQGIMELGATCCVPKKPLCLVCPVQSFCEGFQKGIQHHLPVKAQKPPTPHYHIGVGVIWDVERKLVLIQQRPNEGLLGGLWEFPGGKQEPDEQLAETVLREIQEELGIAVAVQDKIASVKHAYTHFKITLHAYHCQYLSGEATPQASQQIRWVPLEKLTDFAFPKANGRILERLLHS